MTQRRTTRAGFALPTVLGVVALLALVFASGASALTALAASARSAIDLAEFDRLALSAEAEATFDAATTPFTYDGLDPLAVAGRQAAAGAPRHAPLRFDGRPYAWRPGAATGLRLALQDEAGLINLDATRTDALLRLFARLGLSAVESETLSDRLLDALDAGQTRRPRGAKAADYAARGLPPPPPGGFAETAEVNAVLDWATLMDGPRRRALDAWTTADTGSRSFNVNSAPADVLAIVLNLQPDAAARIVRAREAAPITALAQVGLGGGDPASSAMRPNGRLRFGFTDLRRGFTYTSRIAPGSDPRGPPWSAASALLARTQPSTPAADAPVFPDPADPTPAR